MSNTALGMGITEEAPPREAGAPPAPTLTRNVLRAGQVLSDTFEIRGLLGEGGMGQVYEAHDRLLDRRVAIKVPWPHVTTSVRKEAKALAALRHPCTASIYGVWRDGELEYAVMERIHGVSLEEHLQRRKRSGKPLTIDEVLDVLAGIADALDVVHRAGMAHRDVKPANIMLAPGQRVVLMDFGIFQPEVLRTTSKNVSGSPWYMAPEALSNTIARGEMFLVDMYALGAVAFELLTGDPPFKGDNVMQIVHEQIASPVPDLGQARADVPPRLCALVRELLAKDPKERPESMDVVAWQLRRMRGRDERAASGPSSERRAFAPERSATRLRPTALCVREEIVPRARGACAAGEPSAQPGRADPRE